MGKPPTPKRAVDEDLIRQLSRLLEETGLSEIEYGEGDWRVRVARGDRPAAAPEAPEAGKATAKPAQKPAGGEAAADLSKAVTSPMVGVVYTSAEPGQPPFVKAGDQVTEGQTLLLIEAMKVFNPITATRAGRVTRILVTNGAPVEFGEPLLILE
jgi:acetyl-CoA carboxylase biotin carboxyl carrier protein